MNDSLQTEVAFRVANGARQVTVKQFIAAWRSLGYRLDRSMDCRSVARYLNGGRSYPSLAAYPRQVDDGMSMFHYQARRDAKFRAAQNLRNEIFAVSRGAILEV